jgi:hypothetical protein
MDNREFAVLEESYKQAKMFQEQANNLQNIINKLKGYEYESFNLQLRPIKGGETIHITMSPEDMKDFIQTLALKEKRQWEAFSSMDVVRAINAIRNFYNKQIKPTNEGETK